jgi:hypothetical protein
MCNHSAVAKALAQAIALFTIGVSVNSTWAGSDQPSGLFFTPIPSKVIFQTLTSDGHPDPSSILHRVLKLCLIPGAECDPSKPEQCCSNVCIVSGSDENIAFECD